MSTAFVLSGGGSLGAIQVGMLQALTERHIHADVLYGTSVGAINAAYLAGPGTPDQRIESLARMWRSMRRRDIFAVAPSAGCGAVAGRRPSLFSAEPLRRLLRSNLGYRTLQDAGTQLRLVTTDLSSGRQLLLDEGDIVSAILASAAVPGLLPPVWRDGRVMVDGGISEHQVLAHAAGLGVDEIYLLPAGYPCDLPAAPRSAIGIALQALGILIQHQLVGEVSRYAGAATLRVLPPLCPLRVSPADFGHADELITRARTATSRWIDEGGTQRPDPARFLSLHDHQ